MTTLRAVADADRWIEGSREGLKCSEFVAIGVVITVVAILSRVPNALDWGVVAVYSLFAEWSAVALFAEGTTGLRQREGEA